ncbi:uncharacterized protein LOC128556551 [Mercenaria mercenaria]|uniref:uncharacterized protein LOC128556551 n=1 Tax=Mercenaria mercenaria TaxID=6596 RepID=UPI00234F06A0|nr:uncharacterized protein LOC128556551 [Mercenaria mercenaria]
MKRKGEKSRKKTHFQKGYTPWNKGLKLPVSSSDDNEPEIQPSTSRMNTDEFSLVTKMSADGSTLTTPDCEGFSRAPRLLRPKPNTDTDLKSEGKNSKPCEGMRLVDNEKMTQAFNTAIQGHMNSSECQQPDFEVAREKKWGMCW